MCAAAEHAKRPTATCHNAHAYRTLRHDRLQNTQKHCTGTTPGRGTQKVGATVEKRQPRISAASFGGMGGC